MEMLNKNSEEMRTIVETFIIEETVDLIYDNDKLDKWNSLVSELGLNGQTEIVKADKSPIPFMHLKSSHVNMFETLCPRKVDVKNYNITPIPVEILDLIALSIRENYFERVEIWYDDKSPDPVCVGVNYQTWYSQNDGGSLKESFKTKEEAQSFMNTNEWFKNKPYPTNEIKYLLGKWADVKHSFEELKEIAIKRFKSSKENELKQRIKDLNRELDDLDNESFNRFN